jgi:hypothetical protein
MQPGAHKRYVNAVDKLVAFFSGPRRPRYIRQVPPGPPVAKQDSTNAAFG